MPDLDAPSPLERFAVPHQFAPRLSLWGALIAVAAALTRIIGGSLIGALWGVQIWMAGASSHSLFWKIAIISLLAVGLAICLTMLLWAVHACTRRFHKP